MRLFAVPPDPTAKAPLLAPLQNMGPWDRAENVVQPAFVDDGRGLLCVDAGRPLRWWDTTTGQEIRRIPVVGNACRILTSPDGKYFVVCGFNQAQLYDAANARPIGQAMPQDAHSYDAAFSPDATTLVTVSHHNARLWSVPDGTPITAAISHPGDVKQAAFSGDGRFFATGQEDGLVRVWRVPRANPRDRQFAVEGRTYAQLDGNGRHVITTGSYLDGPSSILRKARVYDIISGKPAVRELPVGGPLVDAALSPDGLTATTLSATAAAFDTAAVSTGDKAGELQFWNWKTGEPRFDALPIFSPPGRVSYSPDGRHVVANCRGGRILLMDPDQGRVIFRLQHGSGARASNLSPGVCFAPDSKSFFTWGVDKTLCVWETATGELLYQPLSHDHDCTDAQASADGRFLVSASRDKTVRIWDAATGQIIGEVLRHPDFVFKACFSPDAKHVLTGGDDGIARLWDWRSGHLVCAPFRHDGGVYGAAFSSDGRWLLTASWDKLRASGNGRPGNR